MVIDLGFFDWLSAFSYGLIALSYSMRDIKWLRIITVAACTFDIFIYYYIRPGQPMWVQMVMSILFIAINGYQLYVLWKESQESSFEDEPRRLYVSVFNLLTPGEFKRLLKLGSFETLQAGDELLMKDTHAEAISVVIKGTLDVKVGHNALSKIGVGGFAGEMSYFTGRAPSVNVTAAVTTRIFRIGLAKFEHLRGEHPEMHMKLIGILARDVAEKLRQTTSVIGGQVQASTS